jgi:hypothetical protein
MSPFSEVAGRAFVCALVGAEDEFLHWFKWFNLYWLSNIPMHDAPLD